VKSEHQDFKSTLTHSLQFPFTLGAMRNFFLFVGIVLLLGLGAFIFLQTRAQPPIPTPSPIASPLASAPPATTPSPTTPILLETPRENETITSPLTVRGRARGQWFFEGSFPIVLTNWDGLIIAEGIATAEGEWMTEEYVPFEATLTFTSDTTVSNRGTLILQRENPSGLPENDDALEITVFFQ
jgi:hypothetical protein